MIECRFYFFGRGSKDVMACLAEMSLAWQPIHRSESVIDRLKSQLSIKNGNANSGGTKQGSQ